MDVKKNTSWRQQPVSVLSNTGTFIQDCSPQTATILLKKKLVVVANINPLTVQMNCEYKNQIEEAEILIKSKIKKKEKAQKKYQIAYYNKNKSIGRKKAPKKIRRQKGDKKKRTNESAKVLMNNNKDAIVEKLFKRKTIWNLTKGEIKQIGESQDWRCFYCTKDAEDCSLNHYLPIKLGGLANKKNTVIACKGCGSLKRQKHPKEFYEYILKYGIKGYIYENSLFFKKISKEQDKNKVKKNGTKKIKKC